MSTFTMILFFVCLNATIITTGVVTSLVVSMKIDRQVVAKSISKGP